MVAIRNTKRVQTVQGTHAVDQVIKAIKKHDRYLITSHINLEGDSLGSQLAMANLVERMGKRFTIVDSDKVPDHYRFLPHADRIRDAGSVKNNRFDAAIVLDCPTLKRTGRVKEIVQGIPFVINIDHHISNERFGDVIWVEDGASSVGEMIYELYSRTGYTMSRETALYLYISILTDTGSFHYSNTSAVTHEIVGKLLKHGVVPSDVSKSIYGSKGIGEIKLLGRVLSRVTVAAHGAIAYAFVRKADFRQTKTRPVACENFVNFARSIKDVKVALFIREDQSAKNVYHVSFRSSKNIDVNKIASHFGGGGHKNASGCSVRGNFRKVKDAIIKRVKGELS